MGTLFDNIFKYKILIIFYIDNIFCFRRIFMNMYPFFAVSKPLESAELALSHGLWTEFVTFFSRKIWQNHCAALFIVLRHNSIKIPKYMFFSECQFIIMLQFWTSKFGLKFDPRRPKYLFIFGSNFDPPEKYLYIYLEGGFRIIFWAY